MFDEINLNAFISSAHAIDIKKQQQKQLQDSVKNIRKANESVEEYKIRMSKVLEENKAAFSNQNTDILKQRLENLDVSSIATKNRVAIENLIKEAQAIKALAQNNKQNLENIDIVSLNKTLELANAKLKSLQGNNKNTNLGSGIFADSFKRKEKSNDLLDKLLKGKNKNV